jgi:hypothetical protein
MGPGFVMLGWLLLILIAEIILSPFTIWGVSRFAKTKKKIWIVPILPALIPLALPPIFIGLSTLSFLFGGEFGPTKKPTEAEMAGEYFISEASKRFLIDEKNYSNLPDTIALKLEKNGVLIWINKPDCIENGFGESNRQFFNRIESWKIAESNMIDSFISGWPMNYGQLKIWKKNKKFRIVVTVGDPDSGKEIAFERLNGPA